MPRFAATITPGERVPADQQGLQKQIIHLTEAAQAECIEIGVDRKTLEHDLRQIINSLIAPESRNAEHRRNGAPPPNSPKPTSIRPRTIYAACKNPTPPTAALWNSYS